jgi:hypothetical protein
VIEGIGEATLPVSPDEALAVVLDLERYRQADHKIGHVKWVRPDATGATVRFRGKVAGMPGPYVVQRIDRNGNRLDVHSVAPAWMNRMVSFEGVIECTPVEGGTRFFHREALTFHGPFRLLEPMLRGWLAKDTPAEVGRIAALLSR